MQLLVTNATVLQAVIVLNYFPKLERLNIS